VVNAKTFYLLLYSMAHTTILLSAIDILHSKLYIQLSKLRFDIRQTKKKLYYVLTCHQNYIRRNSLRGVSKKVLNPIE